jgi:predicted transcriptional regulator
MVGDKTVTTYYDDVIKLLCMEPFTYNDLYRELGYSRTEVNTLVTLLYKKKIIVRLPKKAFGGLYQYKISDYIRITLKNSKPC